MKKTEKNQSFYYIFKQLSYIICNIFYLLFRVNPILSECNQLTPTLSMSSTFKKNFIIFIFFYLFLLLMLYLISKISCLFTILLILSSFKSEKRIKYKSFFGLFNFLPIVLDEIL